MRKKVTWMLMLLLSIVLVACDYDTNDSKRKSHVDDTEDYDRDEEEDAPIVYHQLYLDFSMLIPSDLKDRAISVGIDEDLIDLSSDEFFTNMSEVIISRQGIRIGTLFRSIDFLLRTTGSQLRSTCF